MRSVRANKENKNPNSKMENCAKKMTIRNKKADILAEYHRLRNILKIMTVLAPLYRLNVQPDLKSILKKYQPSNEIENPTSMHTISTNDDCQDKDVIGRVKKMGKKSVYRSPRYSNNAKDMPNLPMTVVRLDRDTKITKRKQKVKQGRVEQPLRRSTRQVKKFGYKSELERYVECMA